MVESKKIGLSSREALSRLYHDIEDAVDKYDASQRRRRYKLWLRDALHPWSKYTPLCWVSTCCIFCCGLALIGSHFADNHPRYGNVLIQGLFIILLLGVNLFLVIRDNKLRHSEISLRVRRLVVKLKSYADLISWHPENYPHLYSPLSPCITLQWTYRDNRLVNLPWALLVAGDVVVIRPGQHAPGHCEPLKEKDGQNLLSGQLYSPQGEAAQEFSVPTARSPLRDKEFVLKETPYLVNLRLALTEALDQPVSYFNRQRYLLMKTCVERILLFSIFVLSMGVGFVRLKYLSPVVGSGRWSETLLLQVVAVTLPLLPLVFPAAWLVMDSLGMARIQALLNISTQAQTPCDPFEEIEVSEPKPSTVLNWRQILIDFVDVWKGEAAIPSRSANLLHVLGSVTALCCVDKKGILSWPNPTAEKVFFLRNSTQESKTSSEDTMDGVGLQHDGPQAGPTEDTAAQDDTMANSINMESEGRNTVAEVLDLTHNHTSSFRLQFDDQSWQRYVTSLKPLGLAVLLNTCNMSTQDHYTHFCSHVTCEAMYNEDLVPVINRRCLCELARQIGFLDSATEIFKLEEQLSTFRHIQPEMVRRDIKFARSLSINTKVKFPFPHMVAVVVRDTACGGLQLLSQGTADIVLDSCVDFWDGRDLTPFTAADRKKVLDFYQRTSLTAYCSAFAYRPLPCEVGSRLSTLYMELPADSQHLYMRHRSPTPLLWDCRNVLDPRSKNMQFHSTDSLLTSDIKDELVNDIQGCFEVQCNQVFIGMVTMQYQAQLDWVQLIDQLERACIRFVHFSKENELRSRVFSEKMGLESGWNCHISLLSDKARSDSGPAADVAPPPAAETISRPLASPSTSLPRCPEPRDDEEAELLPRTGGITSHSRNMSQSAPSAINMDYPQVKFDEDCDIQRTPCTSDNEMDVDQGWRSMSCLTDSTEQSAPVNFDMSNRAKLPRGIQNIRPHLAFIDNVPLLVSLFTDCNPEVTREMLHIMQEYGEVVCVIGSAASADNMPILLQADASFAVEPLYPQVCQTVPAYVPTAPHQGPSPIDISRALNSIACSLSFRREDPVSILRLVMESRHFMHSIWNCVQFWMCCCISLSVVQTLALLMMLPPLFTTGQVLWMVCFVVPILSLSLTANPTDYMVMQRATGKNQSGITKEVAVFVLWCHGCKFLPIALSQLSFYVASLASFCSVVAARGNTTCSVIYPNLTAGQVWGGWGQHQESLFSLQHALLVITTVHFVFISISFVQREYSIWDRSPFTNRAWIVAVLIICVAQLLYSAWTCLSTSDESRDDPRILDVPPLILCLEFLLSPLLIYAVVEIIKREEIMAGIRYQKRARLEFGTKLGMNSPF